MADLVAVLYSALILALAPLTLAAFTWRYGLRRTLNGLGERFGGRLKPLDGDLLWVHAASVGEVRAVEPLLRGMRTRFPKVSVALTTTTVNGKDLALKLGLAREVRLAPVDAGF